MQHRFRGARVLEPDSLALSPRGARAQIAHLSDPLLLHLPKCRRWRCCEERADVYKDIRIAQAQVSATEGLAVLFLLFLFPNLICQ